MICMQASDAPGTADEARNISASCMQMQIRSNRYIFYCTSIASALQLYAPHLFPRVRWKMMRGLKWLKRQRFMHHNFNWSGWSKPVNGMTVDAAMCVCVCCENNVLALWGSLKFGFQQRMRRKKIKFDNSSAQSLSIYRIEYCQLRKCCSFVFCCCRRHYIVGYEMTTTTINIRILLTLFASQRSLHPNWHSFIIKRFPLNPFR